jgi:hypothetical protein
MLPNITETTPEQLFLEETIDLDEGFVVCFARDKNLERNMEDFTRICFTSGFILHAEPWKATYKLRHSHGLFSIVFIETNYAKDLNMPKWVELSNFSLNNISLGKYFGLFSSFRKRYLQDQNKKSS